jgi:hypothetical protein
MRFSTSKSLKDKKRRQQFKERKEAGLCVRCGIAPATNGTMCFIHHQDRVERNRKRRSKFVKYRDCIDCGVRLKDNRVTRCAECLLINSMSALRYRQKTKPKQIEIGKKSRAKIKNEVFEAYGGWRCACCGETTRDFLSLDHIEGGGNQQRKLLKKVNTYNFYSWLREQKFPPGYQILCMNCNFAKRYTMTCPHQFNKSFVVTDSGFVGENFGIINPEKAAPALGKLCRFTGNGSKFFPVLLHSLVVSDLLPNNLKLAGLIHDISETVCADVPTPFKSSQFRHTEEKILKRTFESLGLSFEHSDEIKIADSRALVGEIWVYGHSELKKLFPVRDYEAEKLVQFYIDLFPPKECIKEDGTAVKEFLKRFYELYKTKKEKE